MYSGGQDDGTNFQLDPDLYNYYKNLLQTNGQTQTEASTPAIDKFLSSPNLKDTASDTSSSSNKSMDPNTKRALINAGLQGLGGLAKGIAAGLMYVDPLARKPGNVGIPSASVGQISHPGQQAIQFNRAELPMTQQQLALALLQGGKI